MLKIPHNESINVKINDPSIAPVIALAVGVPFAYVASNVDNMQHTREILESREDITVTSLDQLDEKIAVLPDPVKFNVGQSIDIKNLVQTLVDFGFARVERIDREGEFSYRGDTVNIWTTTGNLCVRVMFFGDEIETIKLIDPNGFSTLKALQDFTISPIPEHCHVTEFATVHADLEKRYPIIIYEEQTRVRLVHTNDNKNKPRTMEIKTAPLVNFFSNYSILVPEILWNIKTRGKTVVIYVGNSKALEKYLDTKGIQYFVTTPENINQNQINIIRQTLGVSFELVEHGTVVYSVGSPKQIEPQPKCCDHENQECACEEDLKIGSLVIHEKHGLGRYLGVKKMSLGTESREYAILQYDGGAFVYLPTDQMHLLYNYIGAPRRLDRI